MNRRFGRAGKRGERKRNGKKRRVDRREREGGARKNHPVTAIQQACIGGSVISVHWYHQSHCLISNKSNFMQTFTEAIQFYTAFYTAVTFFATHFQIIIIKFPMTDVKTSSYFSGFLFFFFGSDFSNKTVDILLYTDRHTDRHKYTEQIQRDRRKGREGARQRTRSRF